MSEQTEHRDVFVLSGGAARGAVQVGMMQELLAAGIDPVGFVGTSVGALNSAFMAYETGLARADELAERWLRLETRDVFPGGNLSRLAHLLKRHPYLFSSDALRTLIRTWVPVQRLEDLHRPVRVTTTPLASAAAVYHDRGDLEPLLLASAAVPGVFEPVHLAGPDGSSTPHVDGGVADLIPVTGTHPLAPTRVFVLDATVPARLPHARSPIEVLVASLGVAMRARPLPELGPVEVHHLRTEDLGTRMIDFGRTADHLELGRSAARTALEQLGGVALPIPGGRGRRFWERLSRAA